MITVGNRGGGYGGVGGGVRRADRGKKEGEGLVSPGSNRRLIGLEAKKHVCLLTYKHTVH